MRKKTWKDSERSYLKNQYVEFLVGKNGDFDSYVASVIRNVKKKYRSDNSSLVLVLPYITADLVNNREAYNSYYDEIEIYERSTDVHFIEAIQARNRSMVNRLDLVVFYVSDKSGGAYRTLQYATKNNSV